MRSTRHFRKSAPLENAADAGCRLPVALNVVSFDSMHQTSRPIIRPNLKLMDSARSFLLKAPGTIAATQTCGLISSPKRKSLQVQMPSMMFSCQLLVPSRPLGLCAQKQGDDRSYSSSAHSAEQTTDPCIRLCTSATLMTILRALPGLTVQPSSPVMQEEDYLAPPKME
ncbi:hypothetical protein EJ06DRAFT_245200 [Trichodelitschia bisporula]|uniref:Uncharacterized protein n=1 Tax=Trichodelitschia bisporula TaxID=703511 RepID=A0A6G1HK48_9PEZI|nr:hypothetical protein EJ06DRAFT_245200 [Trichodelitschia bisporula]